MSAKAWSPFAETFYRDLPGRVAAGALDLHLHSTASDGSDPPSRVLARALTNGLRCFALSDHDTLDGIPEILEALAERRRAALPVPDFFPAIELSLDLDGQEVHLLGYFPTLPDAPDFLTFLADARRERLARNERLAARLRELGFPIHLEDLYAEGLSPDEVINRPHFANWLIRHGAVQTVSEAFDRYLGAGRPAYVERRRPSFADGLAAIRTAGGAAVLAHPQQYGWCDAPEGLVPPRLLERLQRAQAEGLRAIEVFHGQATPREQRCLLAAADALGLAFSAGSDDHGQNKNDTTMYTAAQTFPLPTKRLRVAAALLAVDAAAKHSCPLVLRPLVDASAAQGSGETPRPYAYGLDASRETYFWLARRASTEPSAGLWEFPGGKLEAGEDSRTALARELREELGWSAELSAAYALLYYDYPATAERAAFSVRLFCHPCQAEDLPQSLRVHDQSAAISASQAKAYPLLAADTLFFDLLAEGSLAFYLPESPTV